MSIFLDLPQIMLLDLSLAGDNALVVGMAAAGLPQEKRREAILAGIMGATVLRILFAIFAVKIMQITGLLIAGGLLLLWVGWKMHVELQHARRMKRGSSSGSDSSIGTSPPASGGETRKTLGAAVRQIIVADVSMSLDNVLGVAGIARDHLWILAAGLSLSVLLMGVASSFVARLAARYHWLGWLGLAVVLFTALHMIYDGALPFLRLG